MGRARSKTTSKIVSLLDVPPAPPGQRATLEQRGEMLLQLLRQHLQLDNTEEGQRAVRELSQRLSQLKSELSQQLSPLQKSELLQQLSRLQKSASQLQKFFKWGFSLAPLSGG